MLDQEWPARKTAFEAWLAPANFDREGGAGELALKLSYFFFVSSMPKVHFFERA